MHIAVIGAGNIGGTLARKCAATGHQLTLGLRDPDKPEVRRLLEELGPEARATAIPDAVHDADAVVFAIPGRAMAATIASVGPALDGKTVIDATNNIGASVLNSVEVITAAAPNAQQPSGVPFAPMRRRLRGRLGHAVRQCPLGRHLPGAVADRILIAGATEPALPCLG